MSEEWVDRLKEHTEKVEQALSDEKWRDSLSRVKYPLHVVQQRLVCEYCGLIEFNTLFQLQNHQAKCPMIPSVAKENYTCDKCGLNFSSVNLIELHNKIFHKPIESKQELCEHNNPFLLCSICTPNVQYHSSHYKVGDKDLYSHLIESFGLEFWLRHVEMECIQYLERARHKGSYREDIEKVEKICARILVEVKKK